MLLQESAAYFMCIKYIFSVFSHGLTKYKKLAVAADTEHPLTTCRDFTVYRIDEIAYAGNLPTR